jgi:hypothetical protein
MQTSIFTRQNPLFSRLIGDTIEPLQICITSMERNFLSWFASGEDKTMNKTLTLALSLVVLGAASSAQAQFFLRGSFNGYDTSLAMTETFAGSNIYTATATGLTAGQKYTFLAANSDYSIQSGAPFQDVAATANANGSITAIFHNVATPNDGWSPNIRRLGLSGLDYSYELMGSPNGFSAPIASLTNVGGVLQGVVTLAAGNNDLVFRKVGDWSITIKENFGDSGNNIAYNAAAAGDYLVKLDLEGGRYDVEAVPEPATMVVLGVAAAAALRRRKK